MKDNDDQEELGRLMHRSLLPAIFIIPIWFLFGRAFMGACCLGIMVLASPPIVVALMLFHIILWARLKRHHHHFVMPSWSAKALLLYYVLHFIAQVFLVDGVVLAGAGGIDSIASRYFGLPEKVSFYVFSALAAVIVFNMIVLLVFAFWDQREDKQVNGAYREKLIVSQPQHQPPQCAAIELQSSTAPQEDQADGAANEMESVNQITEES